MTTPEEKLPGVLGYTTKVCWLAYQAEETGEFPIFRSPPEAPEVRKIIPWVFIPVHVPLHVLTPEKMREALLEAWIGGVNATEVTGPSFNEWAKKRGL